jgi:hypothetical protein
MATVRAVTEGEGLASGEGETLTTAKSVVSATGKKNVRRSHS